MLCLLFDQTILHSPRLECDRRLERPALALVGVREPVLPALAHAGVHSPCTRPGGGARATRAKPCSSRSHGPRAFVCCNVLLRDLSDLSLLVF